MNMKSLLLIVLSGMLANFSWAQDAEVLDSVTSYTWKNRLIYLPSIHGESETYQYKNGRFKHQYAKSRTFGRGRKRSKRLFTIKNKQKVTDCLETFLSLADREVFKIGLSSQDKDSLIAMSQQRNHRGAPLYRVHSHDLDKYIAHQDTIAIEIKEFNTGYSQSIDIISRVIDGVPFWLNLEVVTTGNDTIRYEYTGNFYDGVKDTAVDEFLIFYAIYKDYRLFRYTPMDKYFSKEQLFEVILRYIAYKENKVNRKTPFRFEE